MATEAGLHPKKPSSLQMQAAKGWEDRKAQLLGQRSHVPPVRTAIELQLHEMRGRGCANTCLRPRSSDKAPRVCGSLAVCEQGRQGGRVGCPAHTNQSVQTTRADAHTGGRAKLRCSSTQYMSPYPRFVCFPKSSASQQHLGKCVLDLQYQKLTPVQGNIVHFVQPRTAHQVWCTWLSATYVYWKRLNPQVNYPGAARTRWHETRESGLIRGD